MARVVSLLVEGDGDVISMPLLFRRVVSHLGLDGCIVSNSPIKIGDPTSAIKSERFLRMFTYAIGASTHGAVIICLDSDDYCPFSASEEIYARIADLANQFQKPVAVCLFEREYESMFLADIQHIANNQEGITIGEFDPQSWKTHRDAKGVFASMLASPSYKETRDQVRYTSFVDLDGCPGRYRPLQHFLKILEWISYEDFSRGYLYNLSEYHFNASAQPIL